MTYTYLGWGPNNFLVNDFQINEELGGLFTAIPLFAELLWFLVSSTHVEAAFFYAGFEYEFKRVSSNCHSMNECYSGVSATRERQGRLL